MSGGLAQNHGFDLGPPELGVEKGSSAASRTSPLSVTSPWAAGVVGLTDADHRAVALSTVGLHETDQVLL